MKPIYIRLRNKNLIKNLTYIYNFLYIKVDDFVKCFFASEQKFSGIRGAKIAFFSERQASEIQIISFPLPLRVNFTMYFRKLLQNTDNIFQTDFLIRASHFDKFSLISCQIFSAQYF